jgi:hypothetical protein
MGAERQVGELGLESRKLLPAAREREPNLVILLSQVQESIQFAAMRLIEGSEKVLLLLLSAQLRISSTLRWVAAYVTPG